jgi:predicted HTH transcriptional regulator
MPDQFSLEDTALESYPRNPALIKWLREMKGKDGRPFVRALSEGTRRMRTEMAKMDLPAPLYDVGEAQTTVMLFNNAVEREALMRRESGLETTEFANLFPLEMPAAGPKSDAGLK